jgi:hypothetical protein
MNIHDYKADVDKISSKCIFCGKEITNTEFEYEDYFIAFRGASKEAVRGFICIDCFNNNKRGK